MSHDIDWDGAVSIVASEEGLLVVEGGAGRDLGAPPLLIRYAVPALPALASATVYAVKITAVEGATEVQVAAPVGDKSRASRLAGALQALAGQQVEVDQVPVKLVSAQVVPLSCSAGTQIAWNPTQQSLGCSALKVGA